jgi:hypothetical protein
MAQIELKLEKQLLTIQNREILASGGMNVDRCAFTFDESWEGYTCTGVFYQDKDSVQYSVLKKDNTCDIPPAARANKGRMYIGVFGVKGSSILTSTLDTIDIQEGSISGNNVSTEPTDDVFLAIISQYQAIMDMVAEQNLKLEEANQILAEQMELLERLNVFEVDALEHRMSAMEITLGSYTTIMDEMKKEVDEKLEFIENSAFVIPEIQITFDENNEFKYEDERITSNSVVNAYFGAIEVETLLRNNIYVESFDGYILFTCAIPLSDPVVCTVEVRGY